MVMNKLDAIWDKVSADIKKNLIENLSTIKMLLKTKMRSYSDEATDFHDKEVPKVGSNSTFFSSNHLGLCL